MKSNLNRTETKPWLYNYQSNFHFYSIHFINPASIS